MTCQECEQKLGFKVEDVSDHLESCVECRWLARELRLNSLAMRGMRAQPQMHWGWGLAAAVAAILVAIFAWKATRFDKIPAPPVRVAAVAPVQQPNIVAARAPRRAAKRPSHPVRVKMHSSDPDVVIYWIVDRKEGIE